MILDTSVLTVDMFTVQKLYCYPRLRRRVGIAIGSVCLSVCLFFRAHKSKTIDRIDLKILHKLGSTRGSVLLEDV